MAPLVLGRSVRSILLLAAIAYAAAQLAAPPGGNPAPAGVLESATLLAVYGRAFGTAPILGALGSYRNFDDLAAAMHERERAIAAVNGGKPVRRAIHLIYAMAIPCTPKSDCLEYLNTALVRGYIEDAAARGWDVILDTQLGRSNGVAQVRRMIESGFLRYDNVHVAMDPEFHVYPGHNEPGIPVGWVAAADVNGVQQILDSYVTEQRLKAQKIFIVHQFGDPAVHDGVPYMIRDKKSVRAFPNVELVIDMDGLGAPAVKVHKYNLITDARAYPAIRFRGIKIFYRDPGEVRGHFDKPPMTVNQIFGVEPVSGGWRMSPPPDVVIIT